MADDVKCTECGLLALREGGPGKMPTHPMDAGIRKRGGHNSMGFETPPYCYVAAFNLSDEYKAQMQETGGEKVRSFLNVIERPRPCGKFCEWDQAKTPKEHADMQQAAEFARIQAESHKADADRAERQLEKQADRQDTREQKHREWQEKESKINREWQDGQTAKNERSRKEGERKSRRFTEIMARKRERRDRCWRFWCGVGAAVLLAVGYLGGKVVDHFWPQFFPKPATASSTPAVDK